MKQLSMLSICDTLQKYDIETVFYIDRLHLYFDASTSRENLSFMCTWHKNNELLPQTLPHHLQFDKKLELYQPTEAQLLILLDMIENNVIDDYIVHYVEFAIDFRSHQLSTAKKVNRFFEKHLGLIPTRKKPHYKESHGELYYSDRSSPTRLTMYIDDTGRKDKVQKSCHLEYRIDGMEAVKKIGIFNLRDTIYFDQYQFWTDNLTLYKPIYTKLGEVAYKDKKESSKKTNATNKTYIDYGQFIWVNSLVLQELISSKIDYRKCFKKITSVKLFESLVAPYLKQRKLFL